ncbi:MAG: 2-phospho-L-lactate transferase [Halobacteriales archaeon]
MTVTFVSGGTGTPKLLDGALDVWSGFDVVVNTADDVFVSGNLVCPDVDTVMYTLAGEIDRERWWGRDGDVHRTHEALTADGVDVDRVEAVRRLGRGRSFGGRGEFMRIGDLDRATHVYRTSALDAGASLTEATAETADWLGVPAAVDVLPMSDDPVSTYVEAPEGEMHFQEWWIARDAAPRVDDVEFRGAGDAAPTSEAVEALDGDVVIGPSNPVTSVGPLLSLDGVEERLKDSWVVAVSPFVEGDVVSGPAGRLMEAVGLEASSAGVYDAYSDFVDVFVVDGEDIDADVEVVDTDTVIDGPGDAARLCREIDSLL